MKFTVIYTYLLFAALLLVVSCKKDNNTQLVLKNDLLKKTTSPAIVGDKIEFVYALGTLEGTVKTANAEASIAGGTGTGFSRYSWYTNRSTGVDAAVLTLTDSSTKGTVSTATVIDTNAVSLRYFYTVPPEARGKMVSFKFSGTSSMGKQVSVSSPAYQVSKMDMTRSIILTDGAKAYFSLSNMLAYSKAEVEQNNLSAKIDFVYIYRATFGTANYAFGHALVALSNTQYISDLAIPASWARSITVMDKRVDVRDGQLKGDVFLNQYIDDVDLEKSSFPNASNFVYGLAADQGAFVKTADGTVAYVYVNAVNNTGKNIIISIKKIKP